MGKPLWRKAFDEVDKRVSGPVEWVSSIAHAQAELTRGVAKVYASTARGLIK